MVQINYYSYLTEKSFEYRCCLVEKPWLLFLSKSQTPRHLLGFPLILSTHCAFIFIYLVPEIWVIPYLTKYFFHCWEYWNLGYIYIRTIFVVEEFCRFCFGFYFPKTKNFLPSWGTTWRRVWDWTDSSAEYGNNLSFWMPEGPAVFESQIWSFQTGKFPHSALAWRWEAAACLFFSSL